MSKDSKKQKGWATMEGSLGVEQIDVNLYRCLSENLWVPLGARGVFGGQIIGLALVAATKTVSSDFKINSLHSYFLMAGDSKLSILFHVTPMRDGKSFMTRQVTAVQGGKNIFVMLCSFMRGEKPEICHQVLQFFSHHIYPFQRNLLTGLLFLLYQYYMPKAPSPNELSNTEELWTDLLHKTPSEYHKLIQMRIAEAIPIEIRPCTPPTAKDVYYSKKSKPEQLVWMRSRSSLPNDPAYHMCVAAYCSDHLLLWTTLRPHGIWGFTSDRLSMLASLDHSMWFHEDFSSDDWLLYEMESPKTSGGRGLALGRLWTRDGRLAVSCAQEGVIRVRSSPQKSLQVITERPELTKEEKEEARARAKL